MACDIILVGRDDARHQRAMTFAVYIVCTTGRGIHIEGRADNAAREIRMVGVGIGVDDGDEDAIAGRACSIGR